MLGNGWWLNKTDVKNNQTLNNQIQLLCKKLDSKNECISNLKKQLITINAEISKMKEFEIEINGQIAHATKMNENTNQQLFCSKEVYNTSLIALENEKVLQFQK